MSTLKNEYNTAFLIGNGESRKDVDLQQLKDNGLLVGCNKIYTEIEPHVICAIDIPMREEILKLDIQSSFLGKNHKVYFDKAVQRNMVEHDIKYAYINRCIDLTEAVKHYPPENINSGILALIITTWIENIDTIYVLGFDFHAETRRPNNLYHDMLTIRPDDYHDQVNRSLSYCNKEVDIIIVKPEGDDEFHSKLKISKTIPYQEFYNLL